MVNRLLVIILSMLAPTMVLAKDCLDCDGGSLIATGVVSTSLFEHIGTEKLINCTQLKLDTPICMKCDFLGSEKLVSVIQLTRVNKLPKSGRYSVAGELVPGQTAWFCRDIGLAVSSITPAPLSGSVASKKNAYPVYILGKGRLGYGAPDKVVENTAAWSHPVKKVFDSAGLKVTKVELYLGGRYPVFFSSGDLDLRYLQLHNTNAANALASEILKGNGQWSFEIVDQQGDRFRYNGSNAEKKSGFDLFIDESTGF